MQHVFEFYIKPKEGEQTIHSFYTTDSARNNKVAKQILRDVNRLRVRGGMAVWEQGDLEEFRLKKCR